MIYREAIEYVRRIQMGAKIKPGLEVTKKLMQLLGDPQAGFSFVHVAGTNGKGSTAAFISSIYADAGQKVGRYVSPAVFSERESIQYQQGNETVTITEEELAQHITKIRAAIEEMQRRGDGIPTEFEIETAAAFLAFAQWKCDLVVLETGMGGRLDATNIITTTACAVITPIAMDHMRYLGDTIEQIAFEKAGIIKERVPAVICQHDEKAADCLIQTCRERSCEWKAVSRDEIRIRESTPVGTSFDYKKYRNVRIQMPGLYQVENACLAIECVEMMKTSVSEEQIRHGLVNAIWRGRFEVIQEDPYVVVDGAHNPDGMKHFLQSVNTYFEKEEKVAVMGVFADKDYVAMVRLFGDTFSHIYTVTPPSERALPAEVLAHAIEEETGQTAVPCGSVSEAMDRAGKHEGAAIFIFGSLSLMAHVRGVKYFEKRG